MAVTITETTALVTIGGVETKQVIVPSAAQINVTIGAPVQSSGGGRWGQITGDLEDQTDLGITYHPVLSTGIRTGGLLSINSPDDSKFKISAGYGGFNRIVGGVFVYTPIVWNEMVIAGDMTGVSTRHSLHVYMDVNGTIYQTNGKPPIAEYPIYIYFGVIAVVPATNKVASVYQFQASSYMASMRIRHLLYALGAFNVEGNVYSASGYNLKLNRSAGSVVRAGANYGNNPEVQDIVTCASGIPEVFFQPKHVAGQWAYNAVPGSDIDPEYYDNLTDLIPVPPGYWTVKPIFFYPDVKFIQYGQKVYATKYEALDNMRVAFEKHPILTPSDFVLRGYVIVKQGATSLNDENSCVIKEEGKFGVGSAITGAIQSTMPSGGQAGQQLTKLSATDFDSGWVDQAIPVGTDGEIQYNDNLTLGADQYFKWDKANTTLRLGTVDPVALPNNRLNIAGDVDSYLQVNMRNTTSGISASSDYILTKNDGDDVFGYGDFGISSSLFDSADFPCTKANDVYLLGVTEADVVVAAGGALTSKIRMYAGSLEDSAHVLDIDSEGIKMDTGKVITNRPEIYYGTGLPPTISGLIDGTLFFKYAL
jgi:hypothetical protein